MCLKIIIIFFSNQFQLDVYNNCSQEDVTSSFFVES